MIEAKTDQIDQYLSILGKNCLMWVDGHHTDLVTVWMADLQYEFADTVFGSFSSII